MRTTMMAGLRAAFLAAATVALAGGAAGQGGGAGGGRAEANERREEAREQRRERREEAREERREAPRGEPSPRGGVAEPAVGRALDRDAWRRLDEALYRERYGRRPPEGLAYAETRDGTEILIDLATSVVRDVLRDAAGVEPVGRGDVPPAPRGEIPPGHLPPPGECRVWYPDRPPGRQPPPGPCGMRVPPGAWLIRG